ncbi:beta-ketoacyl synthase chain length factor [Uliginosibacterium sp. sgz301328]|uniref:beta-ketoacyl synthase chain length factor n=1 Tax=Uliginosibacterium sp. sgz301328 TaxID=3243764 RepID=UPI00359CF408
MGISFNIDAWAAWAPGLDSREAWRAWAAAPSLPSGDVTPALAEMPAMARRRVERLGRIALQAAYGVIDDTRHPLVFASRHGDVGRSTAMLRDLATTGGVSPTSFSLSVHNAIGALFSIVRGDTSRLSAVSAGVDTAEAALIEACGLLDEGAEKVVVVMYDEIPPPVHADYLDEPAAPYAWALRIRSGDAISLDCESLDASTPEAMDFLPRGLQTWQFLAGDRPSLRLRSAQHDWSWRRHG